MPTEGTHTEFLGVQEASLLHPEVQEDQEAQEGHQEDQDNHPEVQGNAQEVQEVPEVQVVQRDQGMDQEYYRNRIPMILLGALMVQHCTGSVLLSVRTDGQQEGELPKWQEVEL